jgi:hypothetical protein
MTDCNLKPLGFTGHGRRKVVADFLGGRLTTDAGVLLLREVDRALGLIDAVNECVPDPRDQRYVTHDQRSMLAQRIYAIALGYEDLNDHETLRVDPALQTASHREPHEDAPLASPSTLCRLEKPKKHTSRPGKNNGCLARQNMGPRAGIVSDVSS